MEKKEPSYTVGGNVNWYSHYGEQYGSSLKKKQLKIELPYDPVFPLLGIYLEKNMLRNDTCTPVFIAALFTIAKTWKPRKCPLTDEWVEDMWHVRRYMCVCICVYVYMCVCMCVCMCVYVYICSFYD